MRASFVLCLANSRAFLLNYSYNSIILVVYEYVYVNEKGKQMSHIRTIKPIVMAAEDTASPWVGLNSKFGGNDARSYTGALVSSDTIQLQLSNDEDPNTTLVTKYAPANAHSTADFGGTFLGGFRWGRFLKTGTAGIATIKLEL